MPRTALKIFRGGGLWVVVLKATLVFSFGQTGLWIWIWTKLNKNYWIEDFLKLCPQNNDENSCLVAEHWNKLVATPRERERGLLTVIQYSADSCKNLKSYNKPLWGFSNGTKKMMRSMVILASSMVILTRSAVIWAA